MEDKKTSRLYRFVKRFVLLFYPKVETAGLENLPDEPCVIAANHAQVHGPLAGELYFPGPHYLWCTAEMLKLKEVPGYAFRDFWSFKPRWTHPFYRALSVMIAPLSVLVFNNAHTIPVYRDARILSTFRETLRQLTAGANVVIFPERNEKYNHILYAFQEGFIDAARFYYRRTGKALCFVPMYVAPALRQMALGKPIRFRPDAPYEEERVRIREALMVEITHIAESLPEHRVVPYRNIPKRDYPMNIPKDGEKHP